MVGFDKMVKIGVDEEDLIVLGLLMKMVTKDSPTEDCRWTAKVNDVDDTIKHETLLLTTTLWRKEIMVSETIEHLVSKFTIPGGKIKVTFPLTI